MAVWIVVNGVDIEFFDTEAQTPEDEWLTATSTDTYVWVGEKIQVRTNVTGIPVWNQITHNQWAVDSESIAWWGSEFTDANGNVTKVPPTDDKIGQGGSRAEVYPVTLAM